MRRTAGEGRIIGEASDAAFHAPILGDDRLPGEVLARLRQAARADRRRSRPGPAGIVAAIPIVLLWWMLSFACGLGR